MYILTSHTSFRIKKCLFQIDSLSLSMYIYIYSWNPKHPLISGCFNWMIPILYIGNGCFTKHPIKNGCLEYQVYIVAHVCVYMCKVDDKLRCFVFFSYCIDRCSLKKKKTFWELGSYIVSNINLCISTISTINKDLIHYIKYQSLYIVWIKYPLSEGISFKTACFTLLRNRRLKHIASCRLTNAPHVPKK